MQVSPSGRVPSGHNAERPDGGSTAVRAGGAGGMEGAGGRAAGNGATGSGREGASQGDAEGASRPAWLPKAATATTTAAARTSECTRRK